MTWPFDGESQTKLILECPHCKNRLRFRALPVKEHWIWSCEACHQSTTLQLAPLHSHSLMGMNSNIIYH